MHGIADSTLFLLRTAKALAARGVQIKPHYQTHHLTGARHYGYLVEGGAQTMHDSFARAVSDALYVYIRQNNL